MTVSSLVLNFHIDSLEMAELTFAELRERERLFAQTLAEEREAEKARLSRQIQFDMFDLTETTPRKGRKGKLKP